jgi:hypothetical protein
MTLLANDTGRAALHGTRKGCHYLDTNASACPCHVSLDTSGQINRHDWLQMGLDDLALRLQERWQ